MFQNFSLRDIITRILGVFTIIVIVLFIYSYLATGLITVSTPKNVNLGIPSQGTYVEIQRVDDHNQNGQPVFIKSGVYNLSARVKTGKYLVSAFNKPYSTSKIVTIKSRQHLSLSLNIHLSTDLEPVYGEDVSSVAADKTNLLYIDNTSNLLTKIGADNMPQIANSVVHINSVHWANASVGVASDIDSNLYWVRGGVITPINLPFKPTESSTVNYDFSRNQHLYISDGVALYESDGGNFKKIYTASANKIITVAASIDKVALIEKGGKNLQASLVVVRDSGHSVRTSMNVNQVSWSPSGKYLVAVGNSSSATILTDRLNQVAFVPHNQSAYTWGGNDILYYSLGGGLWAYRQDTQQSNNVALAPGQGSIKAIYPDQDSSNVYVSAYKSRDESGTNSTQLFRAGIQGKKLNNSFTAFSIVFPQFIGPCYINYVNFTRPTLLVTSGGDISSCQTEAQSILYTYNFDPSKVQVNVVGGQPTD